MRYYSEGNFPLKYGTEQSAGLDLPFYDPEVQEVTINPGQTIKIKTGIHIEIPEGYVGDLDTRSHAGQMGIDLMCRTIDSDYRGNIRLMLINHSEEPVIITRGQYIAQIVIKKITDDRVLEMVNSTEELSQTVRGSNGFGSTNKKEVL